MPDFKMTDVNSKLIEDAANGIGEDISELLSISSVFSDSTMDNLNPYWQGVAKDSFEMKFTAFCEEFKKYIENCRVLNEKLRSADSTYSGADDSVKQLIARIPR